jgi:replicative DNA helicase
MSTVEPIIIGTLLRHPQWIAKVGISANHFADPFCRDAFAAMRAAISEGLEIDVVTVAQRMDGMPVAELSTWWKETITRPENLSEWCSKLRKDHRGRELVDLLGVAHKTAQEGKDPDAIRSKLITRLSSLDDDSQTFDHDTTRLMSSVVDFLQEAHDAFHAGGIVGVPAGIAGIDKLMGGFHKSDLVIVGARTSVGKTAFIMSLALNAAKAGRKVGIISAEMSAQQIGLRLTSMVSNVDSYRLRSGDLTEDEFSRISHAAQITQGLNIRVYDKPACTPGDTAIQARAWQIGGGLDILFVDYLTRLTPDDTNNSRVREVGQMVSSLKTLAKSLNIPVVCLAQINRSSEQRANKRPLLSDLRDSGEIEQEADSVLLLYRDAMHNDSADPESAEILIEKNRHGPCGSVDARFIHSTMTWVGRHDG